MQATGAPTALTNLDGQHFSLRSVLREVHSNNNVFRMIRYDGLGVMLDLWFILEGRLLHRRSRPIGQCVLIIPPSDILRRRWLLGRLSFHCSIVGAAACVPPIARVHISRRVCCGLFRSVGGFTWRW